MKQCGGIFGYAIGRYVALFCLLFVVNIQSESDHDFFIRGNDCYKQQDYSGALNAYQAIEHKGPAVWYNMGNTAYHAHDQLSASLFWMRAQANASDAQHVALAHNIALLARSQHDSFTERLAQYVQYTARRVPLIGWQIMMLIVWWLLWCGIYIARKRAQLFFILILLVCNVMLATMLTMKYFLLTRQRGIVMQLSVPVFAGPHEQYHTVGDMHKAEIFVVHDQRAAWYKISCKKCIGWVQADQVMII